MAKRRRRNPKGPDLLLLGGLAVAGYVGYRLLHPAPAVPKGGDDNSSQPDVPTDKAACLAKGWLWDIGTMSDQNRTGGVCHPPDTMIAL